MKRNSILISAAAALLVFLAGMSVIGGQGRTSLLNSEGSQAEPFGGSDPEASVSRAASAAYRVMTSINVIMVELSSMVPIFSSFHSSRSW